MWLFARLFTIILVLPIHSDALPKKYHDLPLQPPIGTRAPAERLGHDVIPSNYKIDLLVTEDDIKNANFSGTVAISVNIGAPLTTFPIHAKHMEIISVALAGNSYDGTFTVATGPDENDFLTFSSDTEIEPGDNYILTINYKGTLSSTDMDGLYLSTYLDAAGSTHYLATTQFEQMGARRAFPCFDEPEFKATFDISITHSSAYNALSNTAIDSTTPVGDNIVSTFKRTPQMSTYLIAIIVSEFTCREGAATDSGVPTNVCARISTEATMDLALDTSPKALNEMNLYTGIDYKDMAVGKMTQAAIPDFKLGAMENWGMVTPFGAINEKREVDLLWDVTESSNYYKQTVVTVVAHEFAHQWFGDKVTLNWWSNIFLNEGFATYFQYHAAQNIDTAMDWELAKQFVLEQVQTVLVTDSVNTSLPLSYETNDPAVIDSRFDAISYNKGGSILRMVDHLLGLDNFKQGLTDYLNLNPIGTPDNLWNTLNIYQPTVEPQKLPDTLLNVMENWTYKAGYPCLTVTLADDGDNITITQTQFLMTGTASEEIEWYVPLTYTKSNNILDFANTATQAWLIPGSTLHLTLDGADWIILNNQQVGYYRVNYDDALLEKISIALNSDNQGDIDEISRSQIADDQLNFARAGLKNYGGVLTFLGFLKNDISYYTWSSAFNGYSYLLKRISSDIIKEALNTYILEQMDALLATVPLANLKPNEQIYTLKQVLANTWACKLGNSACIDDSKAIFDNFRVDPDNRVNPNLRSFVYCYGLRNSDDAQAAYDFLYDQYNTSNLATERVTILRTLGCVNDSTLRIEYLKKALSNEVRLQDARYVFSSVYSSGPEGVDDVLTFIKDNYQNFEAHFGTTSTLNSLIYSVADVLTTHNQIDALIAFSETDGLETVIKTACEGALANALTNFVTIANLEQELAAYFGLTDKIPVANGYHVV